MRLGLGLGLHAGARSFSPASLFAGAAGAWYDPSDLTTLFSDSAGTTPAVVDGPVARMLDKSGNGNHAVQTSSTDWRPTLKSTGGLFWLEFDGANDTLVATFAINQTFDRISALRQVTWTNGRQVYGGVSANAGAVFMNTSSPNISLFSGSVGPTATGAAVGANAVLTERHAGAGSRVAVNSGAYATGDAGTTAPGGVSIANDNGNTGFSNIRLYGLCMIERALSDDEIGQLRAYLAGKAGVTL